jgi:hypothetical protein
MEGGVELPGAAALLVPVIGEGEEPKPTDSTAAFAPAAPWSVVFTAASSITVFTVASSATIFAMASSATFVTATSSIATFIAVASSVAFATMALSVVLTSVAFSAVADAATEASLVVKVNSLSSDPPSAVNAATLVYGYGAAAASGVYWPDSGVPLTTDPSLQNILILLWRGVSSSTDDISVSLSTIRGSTLPFPLLELGPVLALPW